jgi:molecular chaperone GrpE
MKRGDDKAEPHGNGADEDATPAEAPAPERALPETPEQRISVLEEMLREKTREATESYDRFVREVAEGENFKKRMQRDKAEAIRYANESLLRDLLPVIDNLEWALDHAGDGGGSSIIEGVKLTLKLFKDVLEKHGVTEIAINPGTPFDPSVHEAVGMEAAPELSPNSVLQVQQKGYRLRERLLRPARVTVVAPSA